MSLNYKKGLTRLFLIGLVLSGIVGFFKIDSDQLLNINRFYFDSIATLEKETKDPRCLTILENKNRNSDPSFTRFDGPCYNIGLFWSHVEQKKKSKDQVVTGQFVIDVVEGRRSRLHTEYILVNVGIYIGGYLLICVVVWLLFLSVRWIKRGFTS